MSTPSDLEALAVFGAAAAGASVMSTSAMVVSWNVTRIRLIFSGGESVVFAVPEDLDFAF